MQISHILVGLGIAGGTFGLYNAMTPSAMDEEMIEKKAAASLFPGIERREAEIRLRNIGLVLKDRTATHDTYSVKREYFSLKAAHCCMEIKLGIDSTDQVINYSVTR